MVLTTGSLVVTLLSIAFIFVCLLLVLLILIQRPKGGGLAEANMRADDAIWIEKMRAKRAGKAVDD